MHPATIKVVNDELESGFMIINESDFVEGVHVKYSEKPEKPEKPKDPKPEKPKDPKPEKPKEVKE